MTSSVTSATKSAATAATMTEAEARAAAERLVAAHFHATGKPVPLFPAINIFRLTPKGFAIAILFTGQKFTYSPEEVQAEHEAQQSAAGGPAAQEPLPPARAVCPICGMSLANQAKLELHMDFKHPQQTPAPEQPTAQEPLLETIDPKTRVGRRRKNRTAPDD